MRPSFCTIKWCQGWCWQAAGSSHQSVEVTPWDGLSTSDVWVWCPVKVSQQGLPCYSALLHCCRSATKINEIYHHNDRSTVTDGQAMPWWWGWPMPSTAPLYRGWPAELTQEFLSTFPGSTAPLKHFEMPKFWKITKATSTNAIF